MNHPFPHQASTLCQHLTREANSSEILIAQVSEETDTSSFEQTSTRRSQQQEAARAIDPLIQSYPLSHAAHHARIAIVGAGIIGLNAALTLHDASLSCTTYEASNRIAGHMHTDTTTWVDGQSVRQSPKVPIKIGTTKRSRRSQEDTIFAVYMGKRDVA